MKLYICRPQEVPVPMNSNRAKKRPLPVPEEEPVDVWERVAMLVHRSLDSIAAELKTRHSKANPRSPCPVQRPPISARELPLLTLGEAAPLPPKPPTVLSLMLSMDPKTAISDGKPFKRFRTDLDPTQLHFSVPIPKTVFKPIDMKKIQLPCLNPPSGIIPMDLDDETVVRPESPGREIDSTFVPAEIGREAPKFKSSKFKALFEQSCSSKTELDKIMRQVNGVEKTLSTRYKEISEIKEVESKMLASQRQLLLDKLQIQS